MATGNADFDAILSTTFKKFTPRIEDNLFENNALLFYLTTGDRVERVDGGHQLVEPLMYGRNSTVNSFAGYDNINTDPQEGITAAVEDWKLLAGTVAISLTEEIQNGGTSRIVSLLEAKAQQLALSLEEEFEIQLFADGTGNSSKDFKGLMYYMPDDPTTGTVSGIDRSVSTNSWWRPTVTEVGGVLTIPRMATLYNTVSRGKDHPDFGLTDQGEYEAYEQLLQPAQRFTDPDTAAAGFENIRYKRMALMFADQCPADAGSDAQMFFLNSKYLKLKVHTSTWFRSTPFESPHGQPNARYSQVLCAGNLMGSNWRMNGKLKGLTD